jgi:hypothetical protein
MQKYEVNSPTPGNAPYGFDNERFFRLEMQDLQEQVETEDSNIMQSSTS